MPRRLLVSDTVGSGTRADPYRSVATDLLHTLGDAGATSRSWTSGPDGQSFLYLEVSLSALTTIAADSRVEVLPRVLRAAGWGSWGTPALRSALLTRLANRGYDTSGITNSTLFGLVIRRLGQRFDAAFSEDRLPEVD